MRAGNRAVPQGNPKPDAGLKKNSCLSEIQRLQRERDERRRLMEQAKKERAAEEQRNVEMGTPGDVDFMRMIRNWRGDPSAPKELPHGAQRDMKICICVRKRPISEKEIRRQDHDSVSCVNPLVVVHDCKLKVDGISKYLDNNAFQFDHTFHEDNTTDEVYMYCVQPLVSFVLGGGRATVFAYGQTGSGKTYTMQGIQSFIAHDLFELLDSDPAHQNTMASVSFFEIYGGRCQDLLNNRNRLSVREDGHGEVVVADLKEIPVDNAQNLAAVIDAGNRNRTTHATESNDESSRSHAICQVTLYETGSGSVVGRLSLIDLAGSERGADTKSHNRQRRMEGAEINKSLLALKECIRALDGGSSHVPYRASKLTLVLKDSFTRAKARTVMITNISPAASSADHTINSLRYADRVKEKVVGAAAQLQIQGNGGLDAVPSGKNPSSQQAAAVQAKKAVLEAKDLPSIHGERGGGGAEPKGGKGSAAAAKYHHRDEDEEVEEEEEDDFYLQGEEENELLHSTLVQTLFDEEEALLNLHMNIIQENAELLTEEGRLLQAIQGEDNDIDTYAARLEQILLRKQELVELLREKLKAFRQRLAEEESMSRHK